MFVPSKAAFPGAGVPVVRLALDRPLDPALHLAAALAERMLEVAVPGSRFD